ncbi:MAG: transglutaminase domain-containing protein [Deltaproteobacteria bacterium]|nr:transglutaminase domain-containing protein [Deltaproteobacteria bacterium]
MSPIAKLRALVPHVLRCFALSLAAFALAWGLTGTAGIVAAMLGASCGVISGHFLAGSRLKLSVIIGSLLAILVLAFGFAKASVAWEIVPRMVGPAVTLGLVEILRFAALPTIVCALMRATAVRRPSFVGLELAFVAIAITGVFSAHREGVISRPLWLADWAFRNDIDPARIILGVGFASAFLLAALLLSETKSGRAVSSLAVLAALAVMGVLCIQAVGTPRPQSEAEAGRTDEQGEPPPPMPPDDAGGGNNDSKDDGGGGQQDRDDGGGSSNAGIDSGIEGGKGDGGGQPQPPPSQRLTDDPANGSSPAPVAVVLFSTDYSPPSQAYYFRQEALSQWNGSRFVATGRGDADRDGVSSFPTEKMTVSEPPEKTGRTIVPQTIALLTDHANPFGLESPLSFAPAPNPNPTKFVRAYKVESLSQVVDYRRLLAHRAGNAKWSDELRAYYTLGPTDPRYGALAQKYVKDLPEKLKHDPFALALAVKTHLDKDLTYSKKVHYASSKDPTADFLFGNRIGYCVHFAHAAAILWRSLGIPARVSTGYYSAEDNRKGGSALLIKGGDAHMWPELYLDGLGWVVLDITAARNLDPPGEPQDDELQKLLGTMAREESPDPEQPKPPPPRKYGRDLAIGGSAILLVVALVLYAVKIWRRIAPSTASGRRLARVGYRAALDMLAEVGLVREHGETREAFAERAATAAPVFREITRLHVAASLRSPDVPREARTELTRETWMPALAALRKDLATHTKTPKRLFGFLNPASFLASR